MTRDQTAGPSFARTLSALILFGLAFGYVEGAIVTVLRAFYDPLHARLRPDQPPGDLFPLITLDELRREDPTHLHRVQVEVGREAATIIMLAAVPWTFARNVRQWIAGFMVGFGVWDLAYYATLWGCLGWPSSLMTRDILFLIPLPWSGPVLAPILVSISIIAAGVILLRREAVGRPILLNAWRWTLILLGGSIVVVSFCWDGRSVAGGAMPGPFPWSVFAAGELLGLTVFGSSLAGPGIDPGGRTRPRPGRWVVTALILAVLGLILAGRRGPSVVRGAPILLDDFAFARESVRMAPVGGSDGDRGRLMIVTLTVSNRARRVSYRLIPGNLIVSGDSGADYRIDPVEQRRLDESNPPRSSMRPPIPAGESATLDLVYRIPSDLAHPHLRVSSGGPIGDLLESLTAGSKALDLDP